MTEKNTATPTRVLYQAKHVELTKHLPDDDCKCMRQWLWAQVCIKCTTITNIQTSDRRSTSCVVALGPLVVECVFIYMSWALTLDLVVSCGVAHEEGKFRDHHHPNRHSTHICIHGWQRRPVSACRGRRSSQVRAYKIEQRVQEGIYILRIHV